TGRHHLEQHLVVRQRPELPHLERFNPVTDPVNPRYLHLPPPPAARGRNQARYQSSPLGHPSITHECTSGRTGHADRRMSIALRRTGATGSKRPTAGPPAGHCGPARRRSPLASHPLRAGHSRCAFESSISEATDEFGAAKPSYPLRTISIATPE